VVVGAELVPTAAVSDAFKVVCVPSELPDADDEPDEPEAEELDDELASDGPASATPGVVATAVPTPSATANAPTRPT
jgi:hypothetical protein